MELLCAKAYRHATIETFAYMKKVHGKLKENYVCI